MAEKFELTIYEKLKGGEKMRSDWLNKTEINHILALLSPENRLACEISLCTGLRINDVLALTPEKVRKQRFCLREEKTGKTKIVRLPKDIVTRCLSCSGQHYVFEGRLDGRKHRSRQAVYKDLKNASYKYGVRINLCPHSLRKAYAVAEYERSGCNLKKVQKLLNHESEAVTTLYALSNIITNRKNFRKIEKM